MASDIGHALRDARHGRRITLSDAARHTGVRETHLAALERGELEAYGVDPVYIRGILRTYADYLGLNSSAMLAQYRAQDARPVGQTSAGGSGGGRRMITAVVGAVLLAVVVAGATVAVLTWRGGERDAAAGGQEQAPSETTVVADVASEAPSADASDGDNTLDIPQTTEAPDELTMKLEFTDKVWVRVLVDGKNKLEGIMRPGAVTQFTGKKRIELRMGVAEAVEFSLNGAWYGNVASDHDGPVNVTCTPDSSCKVTRVG